MLLQSLILRARGFRYAVLHVDTTTGMHHTLHARSWKDACEWLACALPEDAAHVRTWRGAIIAARTPTKNRLRSNRLNSYNLITPTKADMSEAYANQALADRAATRAQWAAKLAPATRAPRTVRRPSILARLLALVA